MKDLWKRNVDGAGQLIVFVPQEVSGSTAQVMVTFNGHLEFNFQFWIKIMTLLVIWGNVTKLLFSSDVTGDSVPAGFVSRWALKVPLRLSSHSLHQGPGVFPRWRPSVRTDGAQAAETNTLMFLWRTAEDVSGWWLSALSEWILLFAALTSLRVKAWTGGSSLWLVAPAGCRTWVPNLPIWQWLPQPWDVQPAEAF